jgi:hypothetical protein
MREMIGCSHTLTEEDCHVLKYGFPGMKVDLLIQEIHSLKGTRYEDHYYLGKVLQYPTINTMLPALRLKSISDKETFRIQEVCDTYGLSYKILPKKQATAVKEQ